ncbi:MAG: hypothetical protein AAF941_05880 [Pseudomonadota bacterium]
MDGLNHLGALRVEPDQVVLTDFARRPDGDFAGFDQVLQARVTLTVRADGNLNYRAATFPFAKRTVFSRIGLDDRAAFDALE